MRSALATESSQSDSALRLTRSYPPADKMFTALTAALVYGLVAGLTPGPLLTFVMAQTLRHGGREGLKASLAPLLSDAPIIVLLIFVVERLGEFRTVLALIGLLGTAYLLYLAWETWNAPRPDVSANEDRPRTVLRAALINLINPNPYIFWLTVGTPMLLRVRAHGWFVASAFLALFFLCLVGSTMLLASLVARSRNHVVGHWYKPAMRSLAVLLVVFAGVMAKDAIVLLR